jgi:hypothetical protein
MFVGLKMTVLNHLFGGKFPIAWSLGIICTVLLGSIIASLIFKPSEGSKDSVPSLDSKKS